MTGKIIGGCERHEIRVGYVGRKWTRGVIREIVSVRRDARSYDITTSPGHIRKVIEPLRIGGCRSLRISIKRYQYIGDTYASDICDSAADISRRSPLKSYVAGGRGCSYCELVILPVERKESNATRSAITV